MTRIGLLQNRIESLKADIAECSNENELIDLSIALADAQEELNFAWQDDESDYLAALERQEFNPDGSLMYYD